MGKEVKDTREGASGGAGGGDDIEDGLEQAAEQAAKLNDNTLASLFIEANQEALEHDAPPMRELFVEEKRKDTSHEHEPDPEFLKEIDASLARKEIHHKKLLEEGAPTNFVTRIFHKLGIIFNTSSFDKKRTLLTPEPWKMFSTFWTVWRKDSGAYLSNFGSLTDLYLRDKRKMKKMLRCEAIIMAILVAMALPIVFLFSSSPFSVNEDSKNLASHWFKFILSSSVISLIFSAVPPFFFVSLWFVNVNHLHTSKNFHFFIFVSFTISLIFVAISLFNVGIYYAVESRFGLTSTPIPSAPEPAAPELQPQK